MCTWQSTSDKEERRCIQGYTFMQQDHLHFANSNIPKDVADNSHKITEVHMHLHGFGFSTCAQQREVSTTQRSIHIREGWLYLVFGILCLQTLHQPHTRNRQNPKSIRNSKLSQKVKHLRHQVISPAGFHHHLQLPATAFALPPSHQTLPSSLLASQCNPQASPTVHPSLLDQSTPSHCHWYQFYGEQFEQPGLGLAWRDAAILTVWFSPLQVVWKTEVKLTLWTTQTIALESQAYYCVVNLTCCALPFSMHVNQGVIHNC